MAPLASAFIRLRPDASGFRREAENEMGPAGRAAGGAFNDGFNRGGGNLEGAAGRLGASLRSAGFDAAGRNAGSGFRSGFDAGGAGLGAGLGRGLGDGFDEPGRRAGQGFGAGFSRDASGRLRDASGRFTRDVDIDLGPAGSRMGRSLGDGFSRDASGRLRDASGRFARDLENGPPLRLPPIQPPDPPRLRPINLRVDFDDSDAKEKITGLLTDISKLAAIPVGATLAVGVGAMAGAFGAAALGAGALKAIAVPAINSIKEALAAKDAAEKQGGQTEAQSAQQSFAIAGARQALATALRNAAYSHAQALEGVRSAEKNLADAEKSAVDAERAIGEARKAAIEQLADMQRGLANSALGLRADQLSVQRAKDALDRLNDTRADAIALEQAQLGVRQARARLDEVNKNKDSTQLDKDAAALAVKQAEEQLRQQQQVAKQRELERKEAQLAFEQAQQRYKDDIAARKKQVAEAKAAAKAGVDGSDQVRAARDALKAANDKVAESERALAKARADVGRADQASADSVASARRGLSAASLQAAQSNGTLGDALSKLTPAQRALAKDWIGLTDAFDKFQKKLEPKVLPLFSQGIGILRGLLPSLTPIVNGAAGAVGGLLDRLAAGARSPAFAAFRDSLIALVPQSLTTLGNVAGDVAVGFGKIIQAFLPYAPATLSFIERMAEKFKDLAGGAVVSPGFGKFIDYVRTNGPLVASTASDIAQALAKVVSSLAPLGAAGGIGVLTTFGLLARAVSALSPGQIQALAIAYAAVRLVLVGYKIASVAATAISAVNLALATGEGPLWARALAGAWNGMLNLASAAKDGVVWLWNHARAAAASALATLRLKAAAAGNWIVGLVTGYWNAARAGAAAALSAARNAVSTAASAAAGWIAAGAAAAWTAAQWLLNAALNANPIALIVIGIVALIAAVVLAYKNVGWFRDAVDTAWAGIKTALSAGWELIQSVFAAIRDWVTGTLAPAFMWLWQSVIQPAFAGIGALITNAWTGVIQPALAAVWAFVTNVLAPAFTWLWQNVLAPAFTGIGLLISFAWTNVIQPVFTAVWGFITNVLAPAFNWLWRTIIQPAFVGIGLLITTAWNTVIRPVFQAVWTFLSTVLGPIFTWLWRTIIQPAFAGIGLLIGLAWNTVIKPIFTAIWAYLTTVLGPIFTWLWKTIIQPVFAGIGTAIGLTWTGGIKPVFDAVKAAVMAVADSFGVGANAIKIAWAKIQDYAKTPVNFIIGTVYNKGIRGLWNQVIDWLNLPKGMQLGEIPMLASGGTLRDPAQVQPMMTNGPMAIVGEGRRAWPEYVIPTDPKYRGRATALWSAAGSKIGQFAEGGVLGGGDGWWDKIKGVAGNAVDLVDDAIDLITNPKKVWDKLVSAIPKPNFGGPFGTAVNAMPKKITDSAWTVAEKIIKTFGDNYAGGKGAAGGLAWAKKQAGKPYVWGGVGPDGYDCSGFISALVNVIHGDKNPYHRLFSTASFGAQGGPGGFKRNLKSALEVGVTDAGVGHMAGTLNGTNVESSGGAGVHLGASARGANNALFQRQYGLMFDTGGLLPIGPNNKTNSPEPVLTAQQWSTLMTLAERGAQNRGQVFGDVIVQDPSDIDSIMARAEFETRRRSL